MTLCPIAIVASCNKCPALSFCPLKGTIGDYKKEDAVKPAAASAAAQKKPASKRK